MDVSRSHLVHPATQPQWSIREPAGTMQPEPTEVTYALGRLPGRTYLSRTFRLDLRNSQDYGQPARYAVKVFDEQPPLAQRDDSVVQREEHVVMITPGGRKQIKVQIAREAGGIREIQIQRVPTSASASRMESILTLDREESIKLVEFFRMLEYVPVDESETIRIDDELLREILRDPAAVDQLYGRDPERIRSLIEADAAADDVIAVARRHAVVRRFRELLDDPDAFAAAREEASGPERVWQRFLEDNPWILGVSLSGQLLTAWDETALEQTVAGFTVSNAGKRTDALLRTNGQIRSLVFAEIKHHQTRLLGSTPYRPGCWGPTTELTGATTQAQQTVERAVRELGERLVAKDAGGAELKDEAFLVRPRSYLIVGHMAEFHAVHGGLNVDKFRSFELFRRHLVEPEIITFDELLARAEWHVSLAARAA
jgi:hypothetical protein